MQTFTISHNEFLSHAENSITSSKAPSSIMKLYTIEMLIIYLFTSSSFDFQPPYMRREIKYQIACEDNSAIFYRIRAINTRIKGCSEEISNRTLFPFTKVMCVSVNIQQTKCSSLHPSHVCLYLPQLLSDNRSH
jgi:hypothetical protein